MALKKHLLNLPVMAMDQGQPAAVVEPKISPKFKTRYCQIGNIKV